MNRKKRIVGRQTREYLLWRCSTLCVGDVVRVCEGTTKKRATTYTVQVRGTLRDNGGPWKVFVGFEDIETEFEVDPDESAPCMVRSIEILREAGA